MRLLAVLITGLFFAAIQGGCRPEATEAPAPEIATEAEPVTPNVMIVVVDTLRADRIHAERNGVPVMPFLSEWAQNQHQFTNATSQSSWTKPSVVSLLTSLYVQTHRVEFGTQQPVVEGQSMEVQMVPTDLQTVAELFKDAGYATGAVVANVHLRQDYNFGQGFDEYHYEVAKPAALITDTALAMMDRLEEPWFLYVHYLDPHAPYQPPEPYKSAFGTIPEFTAEEKHLMRNNYGANYYLDKVKYDVGVRDKRLFGSFTETGREAIRYLYDGECRYTDAELKRLFDAVDTAGRPAYRIVTADHGEEFWEHGSIGHSKTLYEELINVPLIFSGPSVQAGNTVTPVELIDVMPTLAAQLNLPGNDAWQGRTILSGDIAAKAVYSQTRMSAREFGVELESVRDGAWKLVLDHGAPTALFNLADDPGEQNNLLETNPDDTVRLQALHASHLEQARAHPAAQSPPPVDGMTDEMREQMEALGYVGGDLSTPELEEGEGAAE